MRLGILGGAFNPPHIGHVICAQEARGQLELDCVGLMPVATPPHRALDGDPGATVRMELCKAAIEGQPGMIVLGDEVERGAASFTVETLDELTRTQPDDQLTLVIGADQALSFGNWRDPEAIGKLAQIAVAVRADANRDAALAEVERAAGVEAVLVEMPRIDISSSLIRDRIAAGFAFEHLVPAGVAGVIAAKELYA